MVADDELCLRKGLEEIPELIRRAPESLDDADVSLELHAFAMDVVPIPDMDEVRSEPELLKHVASHAGRIEQSAAERLARPAVGPILSADVIRLFSVFENEENTWFHCGLPLVRHGEETGTQCTSKGAEEKQAEYQRDAGRHLENPFSAE